MHEPPGPVLKTPEISPFGWLPSSPGVRSPILGKPKSPDVRLIGSWAAPSAGIPKQSLRFTRLSRLSVTSVGLPSR